MQRRNIAGAIALLSPFAVAQEEAPAFDVATVKLSHSTGGMNNLRDPVQATWTNMPLAVIIQNAYHIQSDQLVGGPGWIHSDRWDIIAKTERPATRQQQNGMLRPLLAKQFNLSVHTETRELPEYKLVVAKGGPKLPAAATNSRPAGTLIRRGLIDAHGIDSAEFSGWLRSELGRPVIDETGLKGKYDFKLQWIPDEGQSNGGDDIPSADSPGPSLFAAIRDLGLRLEPIKGPIEVLVIDHVEKPSGN